MVGPRVFREGPYGAATPYPGVTQPEIPIALGFRSAAGITGLRKAVPGAAFGLAAYQLPRVPSSSSASRRNRTGGLVIAYGTEPASLDPGCQALCMSSRDETRCCCCCCRGCCCSAWRIGSSARCCSSCRRGSPGSSPPPAPALKNQVPWLAQGADAAQACRHVYPSGSSERKRCSEIVPSEAGRVAPF